MVATKDDVRKWLKKGKKKGVTHALIVMDMGTYEQYPIYLVKGEHPHSKFHKSASPQRVLEVYDYSKDLETQLTKQRPEKLEKGLKS